jgi:hypothetical protein
MTLKVIGAGFGRTGTDSMREALTILGFGPCHHMFEVNAHEEQKQMWRALVKGTPPVWEQLFAGYGSCMDSGRSSQRVQAIDVLGQHGQLLIATKAVLDPGDGQVTSVGAGDRDLRANLGEEAPDAPRIGCHRSGRGVARDVDLVPQSPGASIGGKARGDRDAGPGHDHDLSILPEIDFGSVTHWMRGSARSSSVTLRADRAFAANLKARHLQNWIVLIDRRAFRREPFEEQGRDETPIFNLGHQTPQVGVLRASRQRENSPERSVVWSRGAEVLAELLQQFIVQGFIVAHDLAGQRIRIKPAAVARRLHSPSAPSR